MLYAAGAKSILHDIERVHTGCIYRLLNMTISALALVGAQAGQLLQGTEQGRMGTSPHVAPNGNAASEQLLSLNRLPLSGLQGCQIS